MDALQNTLLECIFMSVEGGYPCVFGSQGRLVGALKIYKSQILAGYAFYPGAFAPIWRCEGYYPSFGCPYQQGGAANGST